MRTLLWVLLGWIGVAFWTGIGSAWSPAHVIPDAAVVVVVFLGMRFTPIPLCCGALALGYIVGRQVAGPVGLHEVSLGICAFWTYRMSGSFSGGGAAFFGVVTALIAALYHGILFVMVYLVQGDAVFSSWATATLAPGAAATGLLGTALYHPMLYIDRFVEPKSREGLSWH